MSTAGRQLKLLFTGGGGAGSQALDQLFGEHYEVHFADADSEAKPYSIKPDRWHQIPFAVAEGFVDAVRRLCRELAIDLLVPGVDEELLALAQARGSLPCDLLLPPADFVALHLDKLATQSFLRGKGLPAPQTESLVDMQHVAFPCVLKPRRGRGSRDVSVVGTEAELQARVLLSGSTSADFLVQELLVGREYTVMMAASASGRLRAVVPVRVDSKRGITLRGSTDGDNAVVAACAAIHAAWPVAGCYNIQVIKDATGKVKPFEINPRISTTACLGLAAGIDFVEVYRAGESGDNAAAGALLPFREGLGLRRSWHNEFIANSSSSGRQQRGMP